MIDPRAEFVATSLWNAAGVSAAAGIWHNLRHGTFRPLTYLVPSLGVAAWLYEAFSQPVPRPLAGMLPAMASQVGAWIIVGVAYLWLHTRIRRFRRRPPHPPPASGLRVARPVDEALLEATSRFVAAADTANLDALRAIYGPTFSCVRVADTGGFVHLGGAAMLAFLALADGHGLPSADTTVHHGDVHGDTGFVILTRVKDLGAGPEPLYYCLVWTRSDDGWQLAREFVHQRTSPTWGPSSSPRTGQ